MSDQSAASEIASQFANQEDSATVEGENQQIAGEEIKEHVESEDDGFGRKFSALSRKDKEFRDERASWENEKQELEQYRAEKAQREEDKNKQEPQMSIEQRLRRDPLGTLKELGMSYEKLTELALNDGKLDSESNMRNQFEDLESKFETKYGAEIKSLQDKLEEKDNQETEAREQKAVTEFTDKISTHLEENQADYELISAYKANDLVFDVIEAHYNDTNRVLDIADACKAVESHLLSDYQKLGKIEKLQAKEAPKPNLFETPTLSNAQSAQAQKSTEKIVSNEESKANAASLIRWD